MANVYSRTEVDRKGRKVTATMDAIAARERIDVRSREIDFVESDVSPRYTCLPESLQKRKEIAIRMLSHTRTHTGRYCSGTQ